MPPVDAQFTIDPPPVGTIVLIACFVHSVTPSRLTEMIRWKSSTVTSASLWEPETPATLRTASTLPYRSIAAANIASTSASSRDIGLERDEPRSEVPRGLLLASADIGAEHAGALAHERLGRGAADAGTSAGDHGDLAVEFSHG